MQRHLPDVQNASGGQPLHPGSLSGVVKGFEALIRLNRSRWQPAPATVMRVKALAVSSLFRLDEAFIAIRRLSWLAVSAAAAADVALVERGYADADDQVRRLALAASAAVSAGQDRLREILLEALADPSFRVRYEAVRVYGRLLSAADCAPLIAATRDANEHVGLAAIDGLGDGCQTAQAVAALRAFVDTLPQPQAESLATSGVPWHRPAHAIVALSRLDREQGSLLLPRFATHPMWQVRAYAARAAVNLGDAARLERIVIDDESENVRFEALQGLRQLRGHAADAQFIAALDSPDPQLVLAAAEALEGSPAAAAAVPALVRAFARLTTARRDTLRDPRVALLVRLRELGSREHAGALGGCLKDFDPVVAAACADTLGRWTGTTLAPQPARVDPQPFIDRLPDRARVVMASGRSFDLSLLTGDAPASVSRFATLARRRYYDGLTFHRVIPNFIIQGGSPGANEYAGDGPFMRDELGLQSNVRGTVGVSTRGRDTGDAQFFINLLDNPRLDHEYTVFAIVTSGMEVVDAILEGDVIERVEIL